MHLSHYEDNLILVDQKLHASLNQRVQLLVYHIEANNSHQIWDKTREPMSISNIMRYNNFAQIVENQSNDNDKHQEYVNMGILTKEFWYMCKTLFEG